MMFILPDSLKLYSGVLPSSPFIEGDVFSPSFQIYPRVPADIDITLTILPNSSQDELVEHHISGKANEFGYFFPLDAEPILFNRGESIGLISPPAMLMNVMYTGWEAHPGGV